MTTEQTRLLLRSAFFALFVLAPPLNLLRFDLTQGHAIFLGQPWVIGIDQFVAGEIGAGELALRVLGRVFLPLLLAAALLMGVAYRWGRVYCGWLCPHFSVVETINGLMRRTLGKHSLWDRQRLPERRPDGRLRRWSAGWWPVTLASALAFAFLWAVVLLTYLLPPATIYANLWHGTLTANQARFIGVATLLLFIEFTLARHLFCRFGCAVGLFQSLAWMANPRALVVGFDQRRARACQACDSACDHACPMRLHPRTVKRAMFACTQCGQCIQACSQVQRHAPQGSLLRWVDGPCALSKSGRATDTRPQAPQKCFASRGHPSPRLKGES
ncbi:MAG: 4Fe-4S binding protein [Burkholderiales bacterium]